MIKLPEQSIELIPKLKLAEIGIEQWPSLDNPLCSYPLLELFESSGAISPEQGWQPLHLCLMAATAEKTKQLLAVMPSYIKSHSYGEYVFDWAWANGYERSGLDYYPKLLTATPLTPCLAPKILGLLDQGTFNRWIKGTKNWIENNGLSGWHINFNHSEEQQQWFEQADFWRRTDIQFHWHNQNYTCFEDFLSRLKSKKRRNILQERRKVKQAGWSFKRKFASEVSEQEWELFYQLYSHTFAKKGGWAQLNRRFFKGLSKALPENCLLIFALLDGKPQAASLFFLSNTHLYGRYWGTNIESSALHFETCYYQGIEYAIEQGLTVFEPGAQGEHKLARGFEAVTTYSYHYLVEQGLNQAISDWILQDNLLVKQRLSYYQTHSAYR